MKALLSLLFLLISAALFGQHTTFTIDDYSRHTIYLQNANRYVKENRVYSGNRALKTEFSVSPGGLDLYVRSRRNRNIGLAVSLIGTAGSLYVLFNRDRVNWQPFFWTSLGTAAVAGMLNAAADKQLNQAVWLRNKDVIALPEELRP